MYDNDFLSSVEHVYTLTDPDACYSFNDIMVVRDPTTGKVYAAHDSGCSCPVPFEYVRGYADMTEVRSVAGLKEFIDSYQRHSNTWPLDDVNAALEAVAKVLT